MNFGGNMRYSFLAGAIAVALTSNTTYAAEVAETETDAAEVIQIIGDKKAARTVAGSSAVVAPDQMEVEVHTDINQLLKTVPGVYIREEDGQGLRPNIGIRAAAGGGG